MIPATRRFAAALFLLSAVILMPASGADDVLNPEYSSWANFKPGATVTIKMTAAKGKQSLDIEAVSTLLELTPDKAIVETKLTLFKEGQQLKADAQKQTISKMTQLPKGITKENFEKGIKLSKITDQGEETLKVDTSEIKTKWYKGVDPSIAADQGIVTFWFSPEVPGGIVKAEGKGEKSGESMKLIVTTFKQKK